MWLTHEQGLERCRQTANAFNNKRIQTQMKNAAFYHSPKYKPSEINWTGKQQNPTALFSFLGAPVGLWQLRSDINIGVFYQYFLTDATF